MYQTLEEVPKMLAALGTTVGSGWKLFADRQRRFALLKEIKEKGGQQGFLFFTFYTLLQYLYQVGLVFFGIGGLAALLGGLLKTLNVAWAPSWLISIYENHSIQLVICAVLWGLISTVNVFSWIAILFLGSIPPSWLVFRQSAGWYNLNQLTKPLEHPKPLFLNQNGTDKLADAAIARLMTPGAGAQNFAPKPNQLSDDERANAALFGCLIEKEYGVQQWGRRDWAPFYAALGSAQVEGACIFSPSYLINAHAQNVDFYGILRQTINQQFPHGPALPESPIVADHVSKAVNLLARRYRGSRYLNIMS